MNLKRLLLLGAIVVIGSLYTLYVEMPKNNENQKKFFVFRDLTPTKIEKIEVKNDERKEIFSLVNPKAGTPPADNNSQKSPEIDTLTIKDWTISELPNTPLDTASVSQVVTTLKELKSENSITDPGDLIKFGFKTPGLILTVKELNKEPVTISFGKENEYLSKRYVRVNSEKDLFLIPEGSYVGLNKARNDFRSKTPIQFLDSEIKEISLKSPKGAVKLVQPATGQWKIVEPRELPAGKTLVSNLLFGLRDLRVSEFIDSPSGKEGDFGLDAPLVTAELSGEKPIKIKITKKKTGDAETSYFTYEGSNSVFKLASDPVSKFEKDADDLREHQFMKFDTVAAQKLDFSGSDMAPLSLEQAGATWKVNGKPADDTFVYEVLRKVSDFEATSFPKSVENYGFDKPRLQIVVKFGETTDKTQTKVLIVGNELNGATPKQFYARVGESGEVFTVSEDTLKTLEPHEEALVLVPTAVPTVMATVSSK